MILDSGLLFWATLYVYNFQVKFLFFHYVPQLWIELRLLSQ